MKNKTFITEFSSANIDSWIEKLENDTNYWLVLVFQESSKHDVFDCKPKALRKLFYVSGCGRFYVVDKKYNWLVCFDIEGKEQKCTLYKSGNALTDFETNQRVLVG
ncbi:hypothetical protein [Emticicia agri]|uniref:Uncharacterized protein n=1 Tax=Emticicia agri TaxID=2492393 RepID=A0A4Q5LXC4_9BACT|nr:hypothetical protein [Emticicia agri]RYU94197.1 hypothetical protein EWM59_18010 [Emticicia agri]